MDIASLIVAIGALAVAGASAWYARRSTRSAELSADAADRSATAAEKTLAIETGRRHDQRRPHLMGRLSDRVPGTDWHPADGAATLIPPG